MTRLRLWAVASLALALAGNSPQAAKTQEVSSGYFTTTSRPSDSEDRPCVIYSLSEMGLDADLGQWVAQTLPDVIEPGTWKGPGAVRYFAPKNILLVHHTSAVQSKVDRFLKELKTSRPSESKRSAAAVRKSPRKTVVPADYRAPALLKTSGPVSESNSYPVPAPVKPPKHLFHFLIRYEGEGIIDDNVVKFMKVQSQADKKKEASETPATASSYAPASTSSVSPPVSGFGSNAPMTSASSGAARATTTAPLQSAAAPVDPKEAGEKKAEKKEKANPF